MPTDSPNRTRSGDEVNLTQGEPQHQPWTALPRGHRNGSTVPPRPALTGLPADKDSQAPGSGIIPGAIAAALFITFLLALYTVLWKCMVSAPLRKERQQQKKKKKIMKAREKKAPVKELIC